MLALALTSLLGTLALVISIQRKNATMAGLIEVSYPIFIVLFTWVLFREVHLDARSALGGAMILGGRAGDPGRSTLDRIDAPGQGRSLGPRGAYWSTGGPRSA